MGTLINSPTRAIYDENAVQMISVRNANLWKIETALGYRKVLKFSPLHYLFGTLFITRSSPHYAQYKRMAEIAVPSYSLSVSPGKECVAHG